MAWRGVIDEYRSRLPIDDDVPAVTLLEGGTPLVAAPYLSDLTGCDVANIANAVFACGATAPTA